MAPLDPTLTRALLADIIFCGYNVRYCSKKNSRIKILFNVGLSHRATKLKKVVLYSLIEKKYDSSHG